MSEKVYRVFFIIQEYDSEGFWNVFEKSEMGKGKNQIIESFENIKNDCIDYIMRRLD